VNVQIKISQQLFAKHKLKKADVIFNTGLERTFAYHLLAG